MEDFSENTSNRWSMKRRLSFCVRCESLSKDYHLGLHVIKWRQQLKMGNLGHFATCVKEDYVGEMVSKRIAWTL